MHAPAALHEAPELAKGVFVVVRPQQLLDALDTLLLQHLCSRHACSQTCTWSCIGAEVCACCHSHQPRYNDKGTHSQCTASLPLIRS